MLMRKFALQMPLILLMVFAFTSIGLPQSQKAYRYLEDFSYMTKDRRTESEKAEDFIKALKRGDRRAFQVVNYDVLLNVIIRLKKEADEVLKVKDATQVGFLKSFMLQMGGEDDRNRATLVQATLPGIFNLDPRVRLTAASWLRLLRPDATMMRAVKLAVGVDVRVIRYDHKKEDFVFTHPRILETVASWQEYYREKDLDWPGVFTPGAIETKAVNGTDVSRIGGQGVNGKDVNPYNRDAWATDGIVSGLDARRWGAPNIYDATRKWEKNLASGVGSATAGTGSAPTTYAEYYRRLNAAINLAYNGVKDGQLLPDGSIFGKALYEGKDTKCTAGVFPPDSPRGVRTDCIEMEYDRQAINQNSLAGKFPGGYANIVPKPIILSDSDLTDKPVNSLADLETTPANRDVYRYYPDVIGGATYSNLPKDLREKLELLLGQNWQQGTRVPLGSGRMYVYVNGYGEMVVGNPWVELTKLDMFIGRHVWFAKIKAHNKNVMRIISKDTFYPLWASIDGETPQVIPFLSAALGTTSTQLPAADKPMLDYTDVDTLIEGLMKNPVVSTQYVIMRALKDIYEHKAPNATPCPADVKKKINVALWEYKRQSNRIDLETGKVTYAEAITVGKAPAKVTYAPPTGAGVAGGPGTAVASLLDPYGPIGEVKGAAVARTAAVGFANANSEVLANSNRPIVANCHFIAGAGNCGKLDTNTAYDLDKLFKQRFYLLVGPDNQRYDYYLHKEQFSHLWNDINMSLMYVDAEPNVNPGSTQWGGTPKDRNGLGVLANERPIEPTAADPRTGNVSDGLAAKFGVVAPGDASTKAAVTATTSFWEAARYVDSLVVFNLDRMKAAQKLINDILAGNRQAFMTTEWKELESALVLTLKRLETIHRTPNAAQATAKTSDREDPTKLNPAAADGPIGNITKPVLTFFDVFQNLPVIREYTDTQAGIYTTKYYYKDGGVFKEDNTPNRSLGGQPIQVRKKQEFIPIVEQVAKITASTYSEEKRNNLVQASLGGLFNKDPRVRLTAIHFLRRLGPDETMLADIEKARNINASPTDAGVSGGETDDFRSAFIDTHTYRRFGNQVPYDPANLNQVADEVVMERHKYEGAVDRDVLERARGWDNYKTYVANTVPATAKYKENVLHPKYANTQNEFNRVMLLPSEANSATPQPARFYGTYQLKAPSEELEKLYKFIRRAQMVRSIKQGDVNTVRKMSRSEFSILAEAIDNEWRGYIPLQSFHSADIAVGTRTPSSLAVFNGNDIRVIKAGIDNTNFLVQKGTAEYLIRFYNFYDKCTDFSTREGQATTCQGGGYEPNGSYKKEIRDAMYYYIQDDIVVQEFELAFNGENPDGRAVIVAGSDLSYHLNRGGERVYLSLPERIRKDIRDAVWGDYERLPEELKHILGILNSRAPQNDVLTYYNVLLGLEPTRPVGDAGDQLLPSTR